MFTPNRRALLGGAIAVAISPKLTLSQTNTIQERPDPRTFESGDLVWPKKSGSFVPYSGTSKDNAMVDAEELTEDEWTAQKFEFIREARLSPSSDPIERAYQLQIAASVEATTYTKFFNDYAGGVRPEDFQTYGAGRLLYVGHVGIIEVDEAERKPYVIEAVYGKTLNGTSLVQRVAYDQWLSARGEILVWHSRLRDLDSDKRAAVAKVARGQIGKPYKFFNFNLLDDGGFYCSKLVWFSVMKATGVALDGNVEPRRLIWFSPLQALSQRETLVTMSSAGSYRNV